MKISYAFNNHLHKNIILFVNIEKKEKERLLIEISGCAKSAWVSKNDVDFLFEYLTENTKLISQKNTFTKSISIS